MGNFLCGVNDFILFGKFLQELFFFFFFWDQNLLNFVFGEEGKKEEKERKKSLKILAKIRKDYFQFC